jgi:uncharacterized protein
MSTDTTTSPSTRILSMVKTDGSPFWTSGRDGTLKLLRNQTTGRWIHPLAEGSAEAADATPERVSGNGHVFTFTVNEHTYNPVAPPPYVIALVQLDEQEDLRIPTNLVNCDPAQLKIGMPVKVLFEQHGDVFVPLFEPA